MVKGIVLGVLVSAIILASVVMYACLAVSSIQLDDDERWSE